ncbi:hypothetical protein BDW59DRAFT_156667 [Aspergillus cavernicola]|uniref:Cell wall protein n=1 Tax=Aspergillus cavernicola TaxID=176166 RepID=A0ABR4J1H2_9EURO
MKLTAIPLLFSVFSYTLAAPSSDFCDLIATYAQNQLTNISPLLEHTANSLDSTDTRTSVNNYLNSVSDALTQIHGATGSSADQFRREITQGCAADATSSKVKKDDNGIVSIRTDASLVRQVYAALADVSRQSRSGGDDGLGGLLDGLLGTMGELLEEILEAVDNLLDGLGLGDLLDGLLEDLL